MTTYKMRKCLHVYFCLIHCTARYIGIMFAILIMMLMDIVFIGFDILDSMDWKIVFLSLQAVVFYRSTLLSEQ